MGCSFELGVVLDDEAKAHRLLEEGVKEIQRIEDLLSEFKRDSSITDINTNAYVTPVHVNSEVMELLQRCQQISRLSQGYFDISVGPLKKLYRFKNTEFTLPSKKDIQRVKNLVGYDKIQLDAESNSVRLKQENMHISMAAIGKGYAADRVKQIWKNHKLTGGYIDASGDLTAFGTDENGQAWKIGIANPDDRDGGARGLAAPRRSGSGRTGSCRPRTGRCRRSRAGRGRARRRARPARPGTSRRCGTARRRACRR